MKRLVALLLLIATPAFASDGTVTILRGSSAPPTPWYQPPPPPSPPEPVVIYQPIGYPMLYPQLYYGPPARQPRPNHGGANGWPLFRR